MDGDVNLQNHFGASAADNITGYRSFEAGSFKFRRMSILPTYRGQAVFTSFP